MTSPPNEFAAAGGPPLDAFEAAVRVIGEQAVVNSVSLTSYNPACDEDDRALAAGLRLATVLSSLTSALSPLAGAGQSGADRREGLPCSAR